MNPLMKAMGGTPFANIQAIMNQIGQLRQLAGGNPNAAIRMLSQRNPQFSQFLQQNQGKSPEQIAKDYGIDWNMVQSIMK